MLARSCREPKADSRSTMTSVTVVITRLAQNTNVDQDMAVNARTRPASSAVQLRLAVHSGATTRDARIRKSPALDHGVISRQIRARTCAKGRGERDST